MSIPSVQVYSPEAKATGLTAPVLSRRISAGDAVDTATGHINVQPHQGVEDEEDTEDAGDEEDDMLAPDNRPNRMLPCRCRMQVLLARRRNRVQVQPQCPLNRETE